MLLGEFTIFELSQAVIIDFVFGDSSIRFLVDEYKADPNTFLYDWKYDTSDKHSMMSQIYIDLGNYLSGKNIFPPSQLTFQ